MAKQPSRQDEPAGFDRGQFKVCDLCGALNYASRIECFVCGWHGHFTTDPEAIHRAGVQQQFAVPALIAEEEYVPAPEATEPFPQGLWARISTFFSSLFSRLR